MQGRREDRHTDDKPAAGAQHPQKGRERGIKRGQMLQHLLADDDVVMLGRDLGIAAGQIADDVIAIDVLAVERAVLDVRRRHRDAVEVGLCVEVAEQRAPAAADIEHRQGFAAARRFAGPGIDVIGQCRIARLAQAVALGTARIDAKGEARRGALRVGGSGHLHGPGPGIDRPSHTTRSAGQPIALAARGSISYMTRTSPGCANGYLSLPRYFLASESMCWSAPSSTQRFTAPRIWM